MPPRLLLVLVALVYFISSFIYHTHLIRYFYPISLGPYCEYVAHTTKTRPPLALITGASSGVGRVLSLDYCARGFDVVLVARRASLLEQVKRECLEKQQQHQQGEGGNRVQVLAVDLSLIRKQSERIVKELQEEWGMERGLNVLVLNHAVIPLKLMTRDKSVMDMEDGDGILGVMEVNFVGSVVLGTLLLPMLEKGSGKIGIIGTSGIYMPPVFLGAYTTSKMALFGFADALRVELDMNRSNVSVTYVVLGQVSTQQMADKYSKGNDFSSDWVFSISETSAANQIACALELRLSYAYVSPIEALVSIVGDWRSLWSLGNRVWLLPRPQLGEALMAPKQEQEVSSC